MLNFAHFAACPAKVDVLLHLEGVGAPFRAEFYTDSASLTGDATLQGWLVAPELHQHIGHITKLTSPVLQNAWYLASAERASHEDRHGWFVTLCRLGALKHEPHPVRGTLSDLLPLADELAHARTKFPANDYLPEALAEEIGEAADAWLTEGDCPHSRHEFLQVACVAMRIYLEGVGHAPGDRNLQTAMQLLEPGARDFFASLKHRPDLSARS